MKTNTLVIEMYSSDTGEKKIAITWGIPGMGGTGFRGASSSRRAFRVYFKQ